MSNNSNSVTPLLDGVTPDLRTLLSECPVAYTQTYKYTQSKSPKGKFRETIFVLQKLLNQGCDKYYLYPEFTLNGEIHYHGFLKIRDQCNYQKMLPKLKLNGFCYMKAIDNTDKWKDYCEKHKSDMETLLSVKLPINHTTRFINKNSSAGNNEGAASGVAASDGGAFPHEAKRSEPPTHYPSQIYAYQLHKINDAIKQIYNSNKILLSKYSNIDGSKRQ